MHAYHIRQRRVLLLAVTALVTMGVSAPGGAQDRERESNAFTWTGNIPAGRSIAVHNINGAITVERSSSNRVEVSADKEWRRGNPRDVRIEQGRASGEDIVICALWNEESTCDADGINTPRRTNRNDDDRNRNNDVAVHFTVRVPDGVRVNVNTINGALEISGATAEVLAKTINGSIQAQSAGGPVRATTVNGSIDIAMGAIGNASDLEYETINGSITIAVPSNLSAQLDLSTVNGRINTDFPITVSGTLSPRRLRGTVGSGAMRLRASTVNGGITLRRGS